MAAFIPKLPQNQQFKLIFDKKFDYLKQFR